MYKWIQASILSVAILGNSSMVNAEEIKFYTGIGMGGFSADYGSSTAGTIKSDNKFGSYLTVSADFNPYLAMEFRYGIVGQAKLKRNSTTWGSNSVTISSLSSVLLKPQFPMGHYGHIYGLLGVTSVNLDYKIAGLTTNTKNSGLSYGTGFNVHIADTWAIGADYVRYTTKQDFRRNKARISGFSANLNYMFD